MFDRANRGGDDDLVSLITPRADRSSCSNGLRVAPGTHARSQPDTHKSFTQYLLQADNGRRGSE